MFLHDVFALLDREECLKSSLKGFQNLNEFMAFSSESDLFPKVMCQYGDVCYFKESKINQ